MGRFVLIPGAWMGGWVWEPVAHSLREHGHDVDVVTLSGLRGQEEDRSGIGLETHVDDVLTLLRGHRLDDVILVGHGTSGVVAGMVADREPDRVRHVVYVEAFLPHDGSSTLDAFAAPLRADEYRSIEESDGVWPVPDAAAVGEGQGLTPEQAQWLVERFVPHPGRALTDPARLTRPLESQPATYVVCRMEHFDERLADDVERMRMASDWNFRYLDTGLWPMVSAPDQLVRVLEDAPDGGGQPPPGTSGTCSSRAMPPRFG